jgi:hypothetical protein
MSIYQQAVAEGRRLEVLPNPGPQGGGDPGRLGEGEPEPLAGGSPEPVALELDEGPALSTSAKEMLPLLPEVSSAEALTPLLSGATPVGTAPVDAPLASPISGTSPTVDLLVAPAVPLTFDAAAEEVAPPRPEPVLVPADETVDLLALPSLDVLLEV